MNIKLEKSKDHNGSHVKLYEFTKKGVKMGVLYNQNKVSLKMVEEMVASKNVKDNKNTAIVILRQYDNTVDENDVIATQFFRANGMDMVIMHDKNKFTQEELDEIIESFNEAKINEISNIRVMLNTIIMSKHRFDAIFGIRPDIVKAPAPDVEVEKLSLSVRALNCLKRERVNSLYALVAKTSDEMRSIRNMGVKTLNEIIEMARDEGYGAWADAIMYEDDSVPALKPYEEG